MYKVAHNVAPMLQFCTFLPDYHLIVSFFNQVAVSALEKVFNTPFSHTGLQATSNTKMSHSVTDYTPTYHFLCAGVSPPTLYFCLAVKKLHTQFGQTLL